MTVPKSWKNVEIEQQCARGFTKEAIAKMLEDWSSVKQYAYICHDKDDVDNIHCHCLIKFKDSVPTSAILSKMEKYGIQAKANYLQKCHKWESAITYLTHRNAPDKYQYDYEEVTANFDIVSVTEKEIERKKSMYDVSRSNEIVDMIANGTIREYNMHKYVSPIEYKVYRSDINSAIKYRAQYLSGQLAKGDRGMEVVFITGESGVGKDEYAKEYCEQYGYSAYRCSNSEKPFDDYGGQDVIIWSDARDNEKRVSEILRLLDNHQNTMEHARYYNKVLECKVLIITSIKKIEEWYKDAFKDNEESRIQLYRRVKYVIEMNRSGVLFKVWNETKKAYEYVSDKPLPNKWYQRYTEEFLDTPEKQFNALKDMFGAMIDYSNLALNQIDKGQLSIDDFKNTDDIEIPWDM